MTDTRRTSELCAPDSEAEALAIEAELRAHGIDAVLVRAGSVGFPGIVDRAGWGTIRVSDADLERAQEIAADYLERDEDVDEDELERQALEAESGGAAAHATYRAPGRPTLGAGPTLRGRAFPTSFVVASISILINLGLVLWIFVDRRPETFGGSASDYDANGRMLAQYFWDPGDAFPSRAFYYDVRGQRTDEWSDDDADGRSERYSSFDDEERMTQRWLDSNEDGRFDSLRFYDRDGGESVAARDRDQNGRMDELRVREGASRPALVMRDADEDGFFESLECGGEVQPLRCR